MKIIFLDIDGVLNSHQYYEGKTDTELSEAPFDRENVAQLKKIVAASGAEIVLTSSWRGSWEKDPEKCTLEGRILNQLFSEYGMKIMDKTPSMRDGGRPAEILAFMKNFPQRIDAYVIIDDNDFGWKENWMESHLVMTDFLDSGLTSIHAENAIDVLERQKNNIIVNKTTNNIINVIKNLLPKL